MDFFINFIVIALFIFPFIALIHETGHAFFLKLSGGEVAEFSIGNGEVLWKYKRFYIRTAYFAGGRVVPKSIDVLSKFQRILFYLGGVLFNFASALILDLATGYELFIFRDYLDSFIFVSYLNVLVNLIPVSTIVGNSDGKKLLNLFLQKEFEH
ncbi:MAG: site-2 protease family protein [Planococcus sp. (in: firmicutes)]|nr:site-2 protease family protein [Planococcus sp. (in: firmicutes)]